jgi:hypothetical protein
MTEPKHNHAGPTAHEFGDLIDGAADEQLVDWMADALHAVVGVCLHHPGSLADGVLEAIRYELTDPEHSE